MLTVEERDMAVEPKQRGASQQHDVPFELEAAAQSREELET